MQAFGVSLQTDIRQQDWENARTDLCNISYVVSGYAATKRCLDYALEIATLTKDAAGLFVTRMDLFGTLNAIGQWKNADNLWKLLDPMGRTWPRHNYRPGEAESARARFLLYRGRVKEDDFSHAEQLAREGKNHAGLRVIIALRGEWLLVKRKWSRAAENLNEAVRMAREIGAADARAETYLALAKFHLQQLSNPKQVVEQLANAKEVSRLALAELCFAIGENERSKEHAKVAYKYAWNDGEPYVNRYRLDRVTRLLKRLGAEVPKLPPYDPQKDPKFPWESEVAAAIEKLRSKSKSEKSKRRSVKKL